MATHFFDIDGTIVNYHTGEWIEGAKELLAKLFKEGHDLIFFNIVNISERTQLNDRIKFKQANFNNIFF